MSIRKIHYSLVMASLLASSIPLQAAEDNAWKLRLRAVKVTPDVTSTNVATGADARVSINSDTVPEFDISYYFTEHIAAELILATSRHSVTALGAAELGTIDLLPPTLTLQYHFTPEKAFSPYVGAGINYTFFYNQKSINTTYYNTTYDDSFGYALQAGFDYMLDEHVGINFDIKKIYLNTDVSVNYGAVNVDVDIDPVLIGVGAVYRF